VADQVKDLYAVSQKRKYERVHLPQEVIESFKKELNLMIDGPVDGRVEKEDERWLIRVPRKGWYRIIKDGNGLSVSEGEPRTYASTLVPTLTQKAPPGEAERQILLAIYKEISAAWRALTEVRFKLMGLVPAVSVVAWAQLISAEALRTPKRAYAGILLALIGLVITIALRTYDRRNDSLYDDLISRGRKIEEDLGVDTALFRGRREPTGRFVNHTVPVRLIYGFAILGWLAVGVWFALMSFNLFPHANGAL
jgi:hypothetical protein